MNKSPVLIITIYSHINGNYLLFTMPVWEKKPLKLQLACSISKLAGLSSLCDKTSSMPIQN